MHMFLLNYILHVDYTFLSITFIFKLVILQINCVIKGEALTAGLSVDHLPLSCPSCSLPTNIINSSVFGLTSRLQTIHHSRLWRASLLLSLSLPFCHKSRHRCHPSTPSASSLHLLSTSPGHCP